MQIGQHFRRSDATRAQRIQGAMAGGFAANSAVLARQAPVPNDFAMSRHGAIEHVNMFSCRCAVAMQVSLCRQPPLMQEPGMQIGRMSKSLGVTDCQDRWRGS